MCFAYSFRTCQINKIELGDFDRAIRRTFGLNVYSEYGMRAGRGFVQLCLRNISNLVTLVHKLQYL